MIARLSVAAAGAAIVVALLAVGGARGFAQDASAPPPQPTASERPFVDGVQRDLAARFATAADAEHAGYFRYTDEDPTGAVSYANGAWNSDPTHPSQLWYDAAGKLLGADFSVTKASSCTVPHLWNVDPRRWNRLRPHVHYVLTNAADVGYEHFVRGDVFRRAGGDLRDPQAATLAKLGLAPDTQSVARIFTFPALWDLVIWVRPNPLGAFAAKNPLVHPVAPHTPPPAPSQPPPWVCGPGAPF